MRLISLFAALAIASRWLASAPPMHGTLPEYRVNCQVAVVGHGTEP
jgi:hypothetical protein